MKLQLDENTLNAYINEAIRQELNENYRVDFGKLGRPALPARKQHKAQKRRLQKGAYNRMSLISTSKLKKVLNDMGYSDDQIRAGIKSGAILVGNGTGENFARYQNLNRQNRKDARLMSRMNMRVAGGEENQPTQETPAQAQAQQGPAQQTWNGTFPWDNVTPRWTPRRQAPAPVPAPQQPAQPQPAQTRQPIQPAVNPQPTAPISAPTGVTGPQAGLHGIDAHAPQQPGVATRKMNEDMFKSLVKSVIRESLDELMTQAELDASAPAQTGNYPSVFPYKGNRQKIGQFQTWFNDNMGGRLAVDGIWGPKSEAAYQQWLSNPGMADL